LIPVEGLANKEANRTPEQSSNGGNATTLQSPPSLEGDNNTNNPQASRGGRSHSFQMSAKLCLCSLHGAHFTVLHAAFGDRRLKPQGYCKHKAILM